MIDGVKISIIKAPEFWQSNPKLQPKAVINLDSGEVYKGKEYAKNDSIIFESYQRKQFSNGSDKIIVGSLHKYANKGLHNYNDFTFTDLCKIIKDLIALYGFDAKQTFIHRLEFGVNLTLNTPVSKIINGAIAYKNSPFHSLIVDGRKVGIFYESKRYKIKIYDKGKQYKLLDNIIRIEYCFKTSDYLTAYNIQTLHDLTNIERVKPLINLLLEVWNDIIFYDKGIKLNDMKQHEQIKFHRLINPIYWIDLNKEKRYKDRQLFKRLTAQYGTSYTHQYISTLMAQKWHELTAQKKSLLGSRKSKIDSTKKVTFGHLDNINQKSLFLIPKTQKMESKKTHNFRGCLCCKIDISNKPKNTKYCSKICNNKINGKRRTERHQTERNKEIKLLQQYEKRINKIKFWVNTYYKNEKKIYSDFLHQTEILNNNWSLIRTVVKVEIYKTHTDTKPVILTTKRAKEFIKIITTKNNANNKK